MDLSPKKNKSSKPYLHLYNAKYASSYYQPSRAHLKKPSKEAEKLQNKLIDRYKSNFKEKLGKDDRLNVKPVSLHVDKDKLETHRPMSHIRPYNVPFHLRQGFESELMNMLEAGVITQCDKPTLWNTKAFPVQKNSDPTKCRVVGDFRGLNNVLLKLYWHTESTNQLLRHIDP